jgi:hypothetical protein
MPLGLFTGNRTYRLAPQGQALRELRPFGPEPV